VVVLAGSRTLVLSLDPIRDSSLHYVTGLEFDTDVERSIPVWKDQLKTHIPRLPYCWLNESHVGLKVLFPDRNTPLYILIELKTRDVLGGRVPNRVQRQYKGPPSQYYHTATVMDGAEFLYMSMSTRVEESKRVDRCVLLGQMAVYRFMGQVKGLYEALRGAMGLVIALKFLGE